MEVRCRVVIAGGDRCVPAALNPRATLLLSRAMFLLSRARVSYQTQTASYTNRNKTRDLITRKPANNCSLSATGRIGIVAVNEVVSWRRKEPRDSFESEVAENANVRYAGEPAM